MTLDYASDHFADRLSSASPLYEQILALGLLIVLAMVVYFAVAFLIGGANLGMIRRNLKRKPKTEAAPPETPTE